MNLEYWAVHKFNVTLKELLDEAIDDYAHRNIHECTLLDIEDHSDGILMGKVEGIQDVIKLLKQLGMEGLPEIQEIT